VTEPPGDRSSDASLAPDLVVSGLEDDARRPVTAEPPAGIAHDKLPGGITPATTAALLLMTGSVLSRLFGLVREQLASAHFGTGDAMAAFTVADNVHTLLFDLAVSGMLQAALIPVLARWAGPDPASRTELRRISGALMTLVFILVGGAVLLGVWRAPAVVHAMTSLVTDRQPRSPETVELTVALVRWILPAVLLLSVSTVMMAVLHAIGRVTAPAMSLALRNVAIVAAILLLAGRLGVRSMAVGVLIGAALIMLSLIRPLRRADALPRPNLQLRHPAVREVLALYAPIFLGLLVSTVATVADRNLGWNAGEDALGAMRYATTLVQLLLGLVASAISLAALPTLARHHAAGDAAAFRGTLGRALAMTTVLILPATFGLAAVAVPTVDLVFHHGATDAAGAHAIVVALLGYLPGTLFAAYDQVLIFAFYARRNTRTPVVVGMIAVGVYFIVALSLVHALGMLGLVLANSAQFIAHGLLMWWLAERAFGPIATPALIRVAARATVAAGGAAMLAWLTWAGLRWQQTAPVSSGLGREVAMSGLPMLAGAAAYLAVVRFAGITEVTDLWSVLRRRLPRHADR
jgi:putative peptidoglycan lipid II flippase